MPLIDFDDEYKKFIPAGGDAGGAIKEIYAMIPSLSIDQVMIIDQLSYFIAKYELADLEQYVVSHLARKQKNKDLNFLSSMNMKSLIKGWANEEIIRGVSVSSSRKED